MPNSPKFNSIFLANLAEISLPLVRLMKLDRAENEITEDHELCDRFVFNEGDNRLLITPYPIDPDFFADSCQLLKFKNVHNLYPEKIGQSLCLAILEDKKLLEILIETIRKNPKINLIAYSATEEFYILVQHLKDKNLTFQTPEAPDTINRWSAEYFDSKAGFRQAVSNLDGAFPHMPQGGICTSQSEILGWASYLLKQTAGCVLKTNYGLAGAGLKIIKKADVPSDKVKYLKNILTQEAYWQQGPIVVEEFIPPNLKICGGAPNIELHLINGQVESLYSCSMRITPEGVFKGVEIGRGAVPDKVEQQLQISGKQFGTYLKQFGYQGNFEIDFVAGLDGGLYPIEANLRRTGGTHVFEMARHLFGADAFENYYFVANNGAPAPKLKNKSYSEIKNLVSGLHYPINGKKEGVILTILNYLRHGMLGYVVIGPNKSRATEIENQFLKLLN